MKIVHLLALGLLACAAAGCGGSMTKQEVYASYGDDGVPMYYRVTLRASGYNGAVEYRAGWFDAQAVDDLFGDVAREGDIRSELAKKHRQAVSDAMSAYLKVLTEQPGDEALIEQKKRALDLAIAAVTGIAPAGTPRSSVVDYVNKKFVIILSNRPDEVIAAVKGQTQKRDTLRAMEAALSAKNDPGLGVLKASLSTLAATLEASEAALGKDGVTVGDLRATLLRVQSEAEATP